MMKEKFNRNKKKAILLALLFWVTLGNQNQVSHEVADTSNVQDKINSKLNSPTEIESSEDVQKDIQRNKKNKKAAEANRKTASNEEAQTTEKLKSSTAVQGKKTPSKKVEKASRAVAEVEEPPGPDREIIFLFKSFIYKLQGTQISNQSTGNLRSDVSPGAELVWRQRYRQKWLSELSIDFKHFRVRNAETYTIRNPSQNLIDVKLLIDREIKKYRILSLGLGISQGNQLFYQSMNSTTVMLDRINLQKAFAHAKVKLIDFSKFNTDLDLTYGVSLNKDNGIYRIKNGQFFKVALDINSRKLSKDKTLGIQAFYQQDQYSTDVIKFKAQEVGLNFILGFDWGTDK